MYVPQKFAADAEYAPQAAARGFQSACFLSDFAKTPVQDSFLGPM